MALVDEIFRAQIAPRQMIERQYESADNEVLTLAFALAFGFLSFIASIPRLVVEAQGLDVPVSSVLLPSAFGTLALLPLFLYVLAAIQRGVARLFGGKGSVGKARRGLFWSFLVVSPWILFSGLISEIVPIWLNLVLGVAILCIFLVNWSIAIRVNEMQSTTSQV